MVDLDRDATIEAGSETTSARLDNSIIRFPSDRKAINAIEEVLDRVIGPCRAPNFDNELNFPYIQASIKAPMPGFYIRSKEILQWRPLNKFSNNHYFIQGGRYDTCFLPSSIRNSPPGPAYALQFSIR